MSNKPFRFNTAGIIGQFRGTAATANIKPSQLYVHVSGVELGSTGQKQLAAKLIGHNKHQLAKKMRWISNRALVCSAE